MKVFTFTLSNQSQFSERERETCGIFWELRMAGATNGEGEGEDDGFLIFLWFRTTLVTRIWLNKFSHMAFIEYWVGEPLGITIVVLPMEQIISQRK